MARSLSRISRTTFRKSRSRDPASCSMAAFTESLVVSGPGVKRSLSFVVREIFKFVTVSIKSIGQHHISDDRLRRGLPHTNPADVGRVNDDIFDRIRVD